MRLDQYMVAHGLASSRTKAQNYINESRVMWNGKCLHKASMELPDDIQADITVLGDVSLVSRGALKLEGALQKFDEISVNAHICADIGASTGGFTQVLLNAGASRVYAVDVGCGQLSSILRSDPRVVNLEKVNARYDLTPWIPDTCHVVVSDVSFISQKWIIPNVFDILENGGSYVFLIKPQFECGPAALNKHGVVTDREKHAQCILSIVEVLCRCHLVPRDLTVSPILGGDGNREYLMWAEKTSEPQGNFDLERIRKVVFS